MVIIRSFERARTLAQLRGLEGSAIGAAAPAEKCIREMWANSKKNRKKPAIRWRDQSFPSFIGGILLPFHPPVVFPFRNTESAPLK